jgi:biotin carboxylase
MVQRADKLVLGWPKSFLFLKTTRLDIKKVFQRLTFLAFCGFETITSSNFNREMAPRPDPQHELVSSSERADFGTANGLRSGSALSVLVDGLEDREHSTVVLVDPLSTGVMLQKRLFALGYNIILVWSDRSQAPSREKHFVTSGFAKDDFAGVILHEGDDQLEETVNSILAITTDIAAVMCGSEHGVLLEDAIAKGLRVALGNTMVRSSGLLDRTTKVDKHAQANIVRKAGLDAVNEMLARSEDDVATFLKQVAEETPGTKAFVVKPQTGAGSVGVTFCDSEEAVWKAYHKILAGEHKAHCKSKYKHYTHAGVLLQEYLNGEEYIVNSVIRNGEIKTTAMFKYDKRPYNGAPFVCFSKELMVLGDEPQLEEIVNYAEQVLKAVNFENGAIHAEIMYIAGRGPVLVELNCRLHGGNGQWVQPANLCMGYDQLSVFMDVYLNDGKDLWNSIPARPTRCLNSCQQVKMRTHIEGTLKGVIPEQWGRILALPSYVSHTFGVQPGEQLIKTIDMPSVPGEVTLVHKDKAVLARDYETLNTILGEGIFEVEL